MPYTPKEPLSSLKRVCEAVRQSESKLLVTMDKLMDVDKIRDNQPFYETLSALWADCSATYKKIDTLEHDIEGFDQSAISVAETELLQYQLSGILREHQRNSQMLLDSVGNAAPNP